MSRLKLWETYHKKSAIISKKLLSRLIEMSFMRQTILQKTRFEKRNNVENDNRKAMITHTSIN